MAAILALILLVTAACGPLFAQRWEASEDGFVLRLGQERIRYRAPGNLWAGRADGPGVDAALFLWHDAWIYERLDGGTAESGPEVDERGWLRQRGTWVTREGAPPMRYSLALEPTPTGAVLHLETEKTAPLKLTAGLWATLSLDRRAFTAGQRLYARPVAPAGSGGRSPASARRCWWSWHRARRSPSPGRTSANCAATAARTARSSS